MVIAWRATARHEQYKNFDRKLSSLMTVKMSITTTAQLVSNIMDNTKKENQMYLMRVICNQIAGLTDSFAQKTFNDCKRYIKKRIDLSEFFTSEKIK